MICSLPFNIGAVITEESRHNDLHWMLLVRVCENVGTLDDLREEAEDVIDDHDRRVRVTGTGHICLMLGVCIWQGLVY